MAESRVLPRFLRMPLFLALALLILFPVFACASPPDSPFPVFQSPVLMDGYDAASWADLEILAGPEPGPTILVIAGVHGDEISGPMAAMQLAASQAPHRGTLVLLPAASAEAMAAGQRWLPGWSDLNRAFPRDGEWGIPGMAGETGIGEANEVTRSARSAYAVSDPTYLRSDEILALIVSIMPDLVLDLHESDQYWTEGDGPALVVPASSHSAEMALELLELPSLQDFSFTGPPPAGSLVAAVDGLLGIPALLVETPDALAVEGRIAVHLAVIHAAMRMLGMGCMETGYPATCCQETCCQAATGTVPLGVNSCQAATGTDPLARETP